MTQTVLGKTLVVEGDLKGSTRLMVRGQLSGRADIQGDVCILEGGSAQAQLSATNVEVAGEVVGNITAVDRVEVFHMGRVQGDIKAPRVLIASGAHFKGNVAL